MPLKLIDNLIPENTTVYHVEGTGPLVYMIPGNPGLSEFYIDYLNALKSDLGDLDVEILAPSHLGLDASSCESYSISSHTPSYSLEQQIQHKIDLLNAWVTSQRDVYILSHSVGSWMTQRVALAFKDHAQVKIKFAGLLTPTLIDIAKSERGVKLVSFDQKIGSFGYYIGLLVTILNWILPVFLLRMILFRIMGQHTPARSVDAALQLVTKPTIVKQALDMGIEEMYVIKSPTKEIEEFWDTVDHIWLYYVKEDYWVEKGSRSEVMSYVEGKPNVKVEIENREFINHSFCIHSSEAVAEVTANRIKELFSK